MRFSQRKGLVPASKLIQTDGIDDELRNSLWSALHSVVFDQWRTMEYGCWPPPSEEINSLLNRFWIYFFMLPSDSKPDFHLAVAGIRTFFFKCKWNQVYDLIEFTAKNLDTLQENFCSYSNHFLERENSAYRFVNCEITQITDETEIRAVEQGISEGSTAVKTHLTLALSLLSDRKKPNYRNSIKESISAVEAYCREITKSDKVTLGEALKCLPDRISFHEAFRKALMNLYGFTSDEQGIRHSLMEEENVSYCDAKFMLVICAAFVNFFRGKIAESG